MPSSGPVAVCRTCGQTLDAAGACIACGATFLADVDVAVDVSRAQPKPVQQGADALIGRTVIGQYVIRSRIGDGGMGAVYRAEQTTVGRDAAIKVLHPQLSASRDVAERFQQEARAASQLNHPNVVTIYNYGAMEDGTLFLAMEFLDGTNLKDLVTKSGPLAPERAVKIAKQIAESLDEAHRRGIVHRDLKPHNVMLVERGQQTDFVKVLDFGLAKVQGVDMTADGLLCGTPRYMSPEQLSGAKVDGRSDLYSLGIVLFEMLAARTPFEADSVLGFVNQHLKDPPPSLSQVVKRKKFPRALEELVARLLAKSPGERPKSAADLARELDKVLDPDASPAPAPAPAPIVVVAAPKSKRTPKPAAAKTTTTSLATRSWSAVVALALVVAVAFRRAWTAGVARLRKPRTRKGVFSRATAWFRRPKKRSWSAPFKRRPRKR
jgi:serine/threonine-protein kinase